MTSRENDLLRYTATCIKWRCVTAISGLKQISGHLMALDVCQNEFSKIYWWISCILTVVLYFDSRLLCHFECVAILRPFSFCVFALILNAFSFECVLISTVFSFWMRSHFECALILTVFSFWMRSHFECALILTVFSFWRCSHFGCVSILSVFYGGP